MIRILWGQLLFRPTRVVALLLAVVVATTSFTVLTGTSETGRLQTVGTVAANFRSAYDILVRPKGSATELEREQGVVRPNFLSGQFGGITMKQYEQIKAISGVEVAAPIAMIGYVAPDAHVRTDIGPAISNAPRELLRVSSTWVEDRGLTRAQDATSYVYVTDGPLTYPDPTAIYIDERVGGRNLKVCGGDGEYTGPWDPAFRVEILCATRDVPKIKSPFIAYVEHGKLDFQTYWPVPMMIAAIDPVQEARLAGLDEAVVRGRYLTEEDRATAHSIPVMVPTKPYLDQSLTLTLDRLPASAAEQVPGTPLRLPDARRDHLPGEQVMQVSISADQAYARLLALLRKHRFTTVDAYWAPGPTSYGTSSQRHLVPQTTTNPDSIWQSNYYPFAEVPLTQRDVQFRGLTEHLVKPDDRNEYPNMLSVGEYDPDTLPGYSSLSAVPLETYTAPQLAPGDAAAEEALGGQDLLPGGNLGGYLQSPPMFLTTLASVSRFATATDAGTLATAPLSAIRVRVADVTGPDPLSRERVRVAAEQIAAATGLDVDITVGSSPSPKLVDLPAGSYGRPELVVKENWVKKGVAVAILNAVDRKSLALFILILLVCGLFVLNAAAASVRARRTELGVLACIGWSRRSLFTLVLGELAMIGLLAGVVGAALAWPAAHALGVAFSPSRALIAIPAAVALAVLAGVGPARRASRSDPIAAVRPAIAEGRKVRTPRGIAALAVANTMRVPGRSLLAAASLAVGVCAVTLLLAITVAFRGVLVGSLLGDAVAVQVRGVDYVAAITTVLLGMIAVADVLYLNIRERAAELATLRVVGWRDSQLSRLITTEGLVIGVIGALFGATIGVTMAAAFARSLPPSLIGLACGIAAAAVLLAGAAALVPATMLRRLPNTEALADE